MVGLRRMTLSMLAISAVVMLLAGCLGNSKTPAEETAQRLAEAQQSGRPGSAADGKSLPDNQSTAAADDGIPKGVAPEEAGASEPGAVTEAPVSTDGALPEGWPAELPPYPGSQIRLGQRHTENGGTVLSVTLSTVDPGQLVLNFYEEKAVSLGFIKQSSATGGNGGGSTFVKTDQLFAVTYTEEAGRPTEVFLQLKPYNGEVSQQVRESYYGQDIPLGFPQDKLPLYPGGMVVSASIIDSNSYMLVQTTTDQSDAVLAFFRKHYADLGWEETSISQMPGGVLLSFNGADGSVTLVTSTDDQGRLAVTSTLHSKQ